MIWLTIGFLGLAVFQILRELKVKNELQRMQESIKSLDKVLCRLMDTIHYSKQTKHVGNNDGKENKGEEK